MVDITLGLRSVLLTIVPCARAVGAIHAKRDCGFGFQRRSLSFLLEELETLQTLFIMMTPYVALEMGRLSAAGVYEGMMSWGSLP